jgi:hypothetical protein
MAQDFQPGDFLVFQIESAYALLRVLAADGEGADRVWHVAAYDDFFPAVDDAEAAISNLSKLSISRNHLAITNMAFESTQVAKIGAHPLRQDEVAPLDAWREDPHREVFDRSVRLMLGLR